MIEKFCLKIFDSFPQSCATSVAGLKTRLKATRVLIISNRRSARIAARAGTVVRGRVARPPRRSRATGPPPPVRRRAAICTRVRPVARARSTGARARAGTRVWERGRASSVFISFVFGTEAPSDRVHNGSSASHTTRRATPGGLRRRPLSIARVLPTLVLATGRTLYGQRSQTHSVFFFFVVFSYTFRCFISHPLGTIYYWAGALDGTVSKTRFRFPVRYDN